MIKNEKTIQEELQEHCNIAIHYSTGDTVLLHALAFAILMGCNPIFVAGADLDYSKGYADPNEALGPAAMGHYTMWQDNSVNLRHDLKVLNESAENKGINIINLNKDAWYDELVKGEISIK